MSKLATPAQQRNEAIRGLELDISRFRQKLWFLERRAVLLGELKKAAVIKRAVANLEKIYR